MSVRSGQSITVEFTTASFSTGAATNADSLPTGTLVVNGVDNAAVVTVTNVDTGRYKAAVTLPTLAIGDVVELSIAATVSTVAGKGIVWRDTKDILLDTSGDVTFNNTSIATVTTVTNQLTAAQIATGVWQDTTAGDFTTAGSIGKSLFTSGNAPGAASGLALVGSNVGTATSVSGSVASVTGNVGGSVVGDVQGKVLGGGASAISGVGVNANVTQSAGTTIHNSDGTLASATASTVTFPTTDAAGNSIPDDARYQYTVIQIVAGTGLGQIVLLTAKNGVRTFNILSGTAPVLLDATSQYNVLGSWRSEVDLINAIPTTNVTTVNANLGTTQPVGFTGTGASALVKGDAVDVGSTAAASATIGTVTNLTNAPTAGDLTATMKTSVENAVWNATEASHLTAGSTGAALNAAGSAGDPWATALPGAYGAGSAGKILGTNLDAQVSTRSAPATAQTIDQTTALPVSPTAGTIGEALKRADTNLDAAVSTRLATSGYTTPPTTGQIATAVMTDVTDTVGADVVAIKAKTDNLPASPAAVGSQMDLVNAPNAIAVTAIQNGLSKPGTAQTIDLTTAVPSTGNVAHSIADALNAARAQGFGKWTIVGTTLTLYASDGTTAVKTFTLDSSTAPTSRS